MRRALISAAVAGTVVAVGVTVGFGRAGGNREPGAAEAIQAEEASSSRPVSDDLRRLVVAGLTDGQRLVAFRASYPDDTFVIGKVSGLGGDQRLVGIDYRVQDRKLYGVGDAGGVYTISTRSAKASKVSQLTVALQGSSFGVDFNPAANRLRVISDTGQNLRHNIDDPNGAPAAGTTAMDAALTYPPATAAATGVAGAAYTNNDLDPNTATTLFDLDTAMDQVAIQSPANAGTLAPTGKLRGDAGSEVGFDIYSIVDSNGTSTGTIGLATLPVDGRYALYRVTTLTGAAAKIGDFDERRQIIDLAIPLAQ
jgi:hypothetical protein